MNGIDGLTLRDFFAAAAMQGYIAGHVAHQNVLPGGSAGVSRTAYEVADEMLKARKEKEKTDVAAR